MAKQVVGHADLTTYPTEIVPAVRVLFDGAAARNCKIHAGWQALGYAASMAFPDTEPAPTPTVQSVVPGQRFGSADCEAELRKLLVVQGDGDVGRLNINWAKAIQALLAILLPLLGQQ